MQGRFHSARPGFVLLEVILAVALFTSVATAMTVALNQLSASTTSVRRESFLMRRLQSELTETAHSSRLSIGRTESPRDEWGIVVTREVKPLDLKNREGRGLDGLYQVKVRAAMEMAGGELSREMETWVIRLEEIEAQPVAPARP
ncbi:MAG: hypothetical protein KGS60_08955 [Verrucomicrobia bacterium]|nr:hypothetical protein [Verrucomicrobiota bacterium]